MGDISTACKRRSESDGIAQDEEFDALGAIYGDDMRIIPIQSESKDIVRSFEIKVLSCPLVLLEVKIPINYPSEEMPGFNVVGEHGRLLTKDAIRAINKREFFEESLGSVVIFKWVEYLRDYFQVETFPNGISESYEEEESKNMKELDKAETWRDDRLCENEEIMEIIHGDPMTDRKSTFQAHLATVHSVDDVIKFQNILLGDRKIAKATHNIMAYRIVNKENPNIVYKDNDDDGEASAGSKLAYLLEMMGVTNKVIIVSRWFGGILLGPDRFKHINNTARILLEKYKD